MKRVMIGSVVVIGVLVTWGISVHTAWSQTDVIRAILGQGIAGFIPEFTDQHQISDSAIFQDANGAVGIGTTSPSPAKLLVNQAGTAAATDSVISGVNGVATGDASGTNSLLDAIRGDATGSATGVDSEVDAVRGRTTGSAVGSDSELDAVVGRSFGDASGPDTQVTGVRGRASGNATGQNASVVGVRGRSSGSATGPNSHTVGISGTADGTPTGPNSSAVGVFGNAPATSGVAVGVNGATNSPDGQGVSGLNLSPSGSGIGVLGQSLSTSGFPIGVLGQAPNASEGIGVFGLSFSTSGGTGILGRGPFRGVVGQAQATSGFSIAVEGEGSSPDGAAIFGRGNATFGPSQGVVGQSLSPSGIGVHGISPGIAGQFDGRVQINCSTFPCITINGNGVFDLAENLPLAAHVAPGDVVVVAEGKGGYGIAPASLPYDTRVAGIISEHSPILLQGRQQKQAAPVAMVGVVRAKATAANGPIRVGDLLTTSGIPGHLMRCPTALRCIGAVVGKALEPLAKGEKEILVMLWRQ